MATLLVQPPLALTRLLDIALRPVMIVLGGFSAYSVQETHPWHTYRGFDASTVDRELAARFHGNDQSRFGHKSSFLFHAPLLGGWKDYAVITATDKHADGLHFGWLTCDTGGQVTDKGLNRLLVIGGSVRMLTGHGDGYFFAADTNGVQVPVTITATGSLHDKRFSHLRLL